MAATLEHDWFDRPLPDNVCIGERSWLHSSFAFVHYQSQRKHGVRIGDNSGVYRGSFFDLGPSGEVEIGNYCTVVGAIFACNSRVVVGDYTFIAHEVLLADNKTAVPPREQEQTPSTVTSISIGANCWIGARAILLAGAKLGEGAIVGAATVVDFEVPPFAIAAGNPARIVGSCKPS